MKRKFESILKKRCFDNYSKERAGKNCTWRCRNIIVCNRLPANQLNKFKQARTHHLVFVVWNLGGPRNRILCPHFIQGAAGVWRLGPELWGITKVLSLASNLLNKICFAKFGGGVTSCTSRSASGVKVRRFEDLLINAFTCIMIH